jgi:hypothetical protein
VKNLSVYTMKPLGEQLLELGLLSPQQLQQALAIQKASPDKLLGQVLVDSGMLSTQEFETFMQSRIGIQQPLGELLIQKSYITREQLNAALSIQMQSGPAGKPLGQLLVEQGFITQALLDDIVQHQYRHQQMVRNNLFGAQAQPSAALERTQVEDIQHLLGAGQVFLSLAEALMPDAESVFGERFHIFQGLYTGNRNPLPDSLISEAVEFFIHFLPVLALGLDDKRPLAIDQQAAMDHSFFALMEGFRRQVLPGLELKPDYALNSLVMTEELESVTLREALYLVMRSNQLLPHGSLMTLRFLLNEFWGQRSILEQRGMSLVHSEDEMDLSDFFRARIDDPDSDLAYMQRMESHLFAQIGQTAQQILKATPQGCMNPMIDLLEFYRTLLQTHKEWKDMQQD